MKNKLVNIIEKIHFLNYQKAIKIISRNISNPTFVCFSDDQSWMKTHLKINAPVIYSSDSGFKKAMRTYTLCLNPTITLSPIVHLVGGEHGSGSIKIL